MSKILKKMLNRFFKEVKKLVSEGGNKYCRIHFLCSNSSQEINVIIKEYGVIKYQQNGICAPIKIVFLATIYSKSLLSETITCFFSESYSQSFETFSSLLASYTYKYVQENSLKDFFVAKVY